jgi:hypothetical protein
MDAAYDRYSATARQPGGWTKDGLLDVAEGDELMAVPLGNFCYQVQNGGLMQWIGNGYATTFAVSLLKRALRNIATPATQAVAEILAEAEEAGLEEPGQARYSDDGCDYDWECWRDTLNKLDSRFYEIDDQFLDDCEAFFASRTKEAA